MLQPSYPWNIQKGCQPNKRKLPDFEIGVRRKRDRKGQGVGEEEEKLDFDNKLGEEKLVNPFYNFKEIFYSNKSY